jgi:UDP-N-acetylglucosamine--N-acetylmuramyl-(pentapeptide) pyrophosphoryl-undecaprenol N-acetylglucosamine transferase
MQKNKLKIIFVGGGTGGHVTPNIAIIDELKKISKDDKVHIDLLYIGRIKGIERDLIKKYGLKYKGIFSGKLRRYLDIRNLSDLFLMFLGFIQSFFILLFNRPDIIFAKGGFVTVPFCLAATLLGIPFFIHESDSIMGLSNKILLPFARKVYLGFPVATYKGVSAKKMHFSGNPVRSEILNAKQNKEAFFQKYTLDETKKTIFVFGGSQGAGKINELIDNSVEKIIAHYNLIHQTGIKHEEYFIKKRKSMNERERKRYLVIGYIGGELKDFLINSDLIISRAGANSVSEIIGVRKPSILIPLSSAASDHQTINAKFLQKNGIASILDEKFLDSDKLYEEMEFLINDKKIRDSMIKNIENIFPENSAHIIAKGILELAVSSR